MEHHQRGLELEYAWNYTALGCYPYNHTGTDGFKFIFMIQTFKIFTKELVAEKC